MYDDALDADADATRVARSRDRSIDRFVRTGEVMRAGGASSAETMDDATRDGAEGAWERRAQATLAAPMSVASAASTARDVTTLAFAGRLASREALGGAALGMTVANIAGKSVLVGLSGAVNTLAGAAYGGRMYDRVGAVARRAAVVMTVVACALAPIWWNGERLALFLGQDPDVARACGTFLRGLIPTLFLHAWTGATQAFLQSQGITEPPAVGALIAAVVHPLANVVLIRWCDLGLLGAAFACAVSGAVLLKIQLLYIFVFRKRYRERDEALARRRDACCTSWSFPDVFNAAGWREYLHLALPGVLLKAEWWAADIVVACAGYLPRPSVSLAAMSIYANTSAFIFDLSLGICMATMTRVTHELGARSPERAGRAARAGFELAAAVGFVAALVSLAVRPYWGYLFTSNDEVSLLVSTLMMYLSVYVVFDGLGAVGTGVLKACGRQAVAAPVVFVSYYALGIPTAMAIAFAANAGVVGLALGGLLGTMAHTCALAEIIWKLDWSVETERASERAERERAAATTRDIAADDSREPLLDEASRDWTENYGAAP